MFSITDLLDKVPIRHIWIFITDRCNLNCDYCFFRYRNKKDNLGFAKMNCLLENLPSNKKYDFIISGGEPLLYWNFVKYLIKKIKYKFFNSSITIQTNILLLSSEKIDFLKFNNVIVEPGIDGDFSSNFRHRRGLNQSNFGKCLWMLRLIVKRKLHMNPTMTVHPEEVSSMFENFKLLVSLGLNTIDIHPAFLADWSKKDIDEFIIQYKKLLKYEKQSGKYLICKNYSIPMRFVLDLVVQPDGHVLPNWTYLAFPDYLRNKFFLLRCKSNNIEIHHENLYNYFKKLKDFFSQQRTYRDFSNFNASLIMKSFKKKEINKKFRIYKELCEKIQLLDTYFLKKETTNAA